MAVTQRGTPIYRRAILGLLLLALSTFSLIYVVQPNFALISAEFGTSASTTSLTLSMSTLVLALVVLPAAHLSSRVGRGRYMALSLALALAATLAAAFAPTMTVLLVLRALSGVGFAGVTGVALAWVADEAAPFDVAAIGGIYIAGTTVGGMAGRLVGGFVADFLGWRGSLGVVAVACAIITVIGVALLPRRGRMASERGARPRGAPRPGGTDGAAVAQGDEAEESRPVRTEAERARMRRNLTLLYVVGCLGMFGFVGMFTAIVFRAAEPPMSMGPAATSLFFLTYLAGTVSSTFAGRIAARLGVRTCVLLGIAVAVLGVLITIAPFALTIWLGLLVMSAGFFLAHALASATGPRVAEKPGQASGRYTFFYYVGSSLGGVALGWAWDAAGWPLVVGVAVSAFALAGVAAAGLRPPARTADVAR